MMNATQFFPIEIWWNIALYMSLPDIIKLCRIYNELECIIKNQIFWLEKIRLEYPDLYIAERFTPLDIYIKIYNEDSRIVPVIYMDNKITDIAINEGERFIDLTNDILKIFPPKDKLAILFPDLNEGYIYPLQTNYIENICLDIIPCLGNSIQYLAKSIVLNDDQEIIDKLNIITCLNCGNKNLLTELVRLNKDYDRIMCTCPNCGCVYFDDIIIPK